MHKLKLLCICLLIGSPLTPVNASVWISDGSSLNVEANHDATSPQLVSFQNIPHVFYYSDDYVSTEITLIGTCFKNDQWTGGGVGGLQSATAYEVRVVEGQHIYLCWSDTYLSGAPNWVFVNKYNGSSWGTKTQLNVSTAHAAFQSSILVSNATPYIAWCEENSSEVKQLYIKYYNGSSWELMGSTQNIDANYSVQDTWLTEINSTPYIAWTESNSSGYKNLYVKYYNGNAWTLLDTNSINLSDNSHANYILLAGINGTPHILWSENVLAERIYMKYFNGTAWEEKDGFINKRVDKNACDPYAVSSGNIIYCTWHEADDYNEQVYVKQYNGAAWTTLGESLNVNVYSDAASPHMTLMNNTPYVVWEEGVGADNHIYVKKYNAVSAAWEQAGTCLKNVQNREALNPEIAIVADTPFVTWQETNGVAFQVYVKHLAEETPTPTYTQTPLSFNTPTATPSPTSAQVKHANYRFATPNPFLPLNGQKTNFNISSQDPYAIKIWDVAGQLQRTLNNVPEWDGRNENGQVCEGGLYIFQVQAQEGNYMGKVVLIK